MEAKHQPAVAVRRGHGVTNEEDINGSGIREDEENQTFATEVAVC